MTHEDDLPAEVRRQDEEDELKIAAQLSGLREEEHVSAARRRWGALSQRTRILLITAAVADGALRVRRTSTSSGGRRARSGAGRGCGRQPWHWSAPAGSCQSHTSSSGNVA